MSLIIATILGYLKSAFTGIIEFCFKYPKETIAVIVICVVGYYGYNWSYDRGYNKSEAKWVKLDKANTDALNNKIIRLELDSKSAADGDAAKLAALQDNIDKLKNKIKNAKPETYVKYINNKCTQTPQFKEDLNSLIRLQNERVVK